MSTPTNSPSQYTDLSIFDKDSQDIFDAAVQSLRLRLPGWTPREDSTEVLLIEAMALEVAEAAYAINRLPSAIMMSMLQLFGMKRHEGSLPTTTITLSVNATGNTIPAGARFTLNTPQYDEPVVFTTTETAYFTETTIADVTAQGNVLTNDLYSVPVGTPVYSLETLSSLDSASIGTSIVGGSAPETDAEWMDRGVRYFQRLVSTLVTPDHFRLAALDHEAVERVKVLDMYNPTSGTVGSSPGHVTVSLYGSTRALTPAEKAEVLADLRARALASLQVHVIDPSVVQINVSARIAYKTGYTPSDVDNSVETMLVEYLNDPSWDSEAKVRRNELITAISNVAGVDYVDSLLTPSADVDLTTTASLTSPGTITITAVTA